MVPNGGGTVRALQFYAVMRGETQEPWEQLCELAAREQDPDRLMELIRTIDRLLAEKEQGLQKPREVHSKNPSQ